MVEHCNSMVLQSINQTLHDTFDGSRLYFKCHPFSDALEGGIVKYKNEMM